MRTIYHEFESLDHLLATRMLPGGSDQPIRFVVFGGTGAVGGAAVLELCRLILISKRYRKYSWRGEIYATGLTDKEITKFVSRVYLALEGTRIEKIEPRRHYRLDDCIDLRFDVLRLTLPHDLRERTLEARDRLGPEFDAETVLAEYFESQPRPFLRFVEDLDSDLLHAVVVAIPLPSVATYTMDAIDRLATELRLDYPVKQRIKKSYLQTFIRGLAVIQQRHARQVLMAHTTAVGGMYRVDGGQAEIRLGFAHSALGKLLVDKKYFADELTQLYLDQGFQVLVTAAAIGIDEVELRCHLPLDRRVQRKLQERVEESVEPSINPADLDSAQILLYPSQSLDFEVGDAEARRLAFGSGKELMVEAAIRSGENGMFSVANCVALYHVMKVAIPEELAMVLVRYAVFGPERRRDWLDDNVCYYSETENAYFALKLLDNYPELVQAHYGAFNVQAYQALGSSTHQARLHELGLLLLVLRLRELAGKFLDIPEHDLVEGLNDLDDFFWTMTRRPCFEDFEPLDVTGLARLFGRLCEVGSMESAGQLLGYDPRQHGLRERGREKFLHRLATHINRYLQTITSLGIPILFHSPTLGRDRVLVGPYIAPLDMAVTSSHDPQTAFERLALQHGVAVDVARNWVIANNGFVDLRPHALVSAAKEPGPRLGDQVQRFEAGADLAARLDGLEIGSYFTTCGLVALDLRLRRLYGRIRQRKIQLGTHESWKHLFPQDLDGRHLLTPGLIETVRMYTEGLGKVTGTEALWPGWGY